MNTDNYDEIIQEHAKLHGVRLYMCVGCGREVASTIEGIGWGPLCDDCYQWRLFEEKGIAW